MLHHLQSLVQHHGYGVLTLVLLLESTGLPLPGESLLIGAAIFASVTGKLSIGWIIVAAATGAILGDNIGYGIGRWGGPGLIARYGPRLGLTEDRQVLTRALFRRQGGKVVFFGRFIAILRTFVALLAGANRMDWRHFLVWNAVGGVTWCVVYAAGAYALGEAARRLSGVVGIALGLVAASAILALVLLARRNEARLVAGVLAEQRAIDAAARPAERSSP